MKKVLITGAAGFIGSNLTRALLARGYSVVGIDNLSAGTGENVPAGVSLHVADIRSPTIYPLFEGVDTVFHLAAKNCLADCLAHPVETSDVNVTGTVNVLEAARQARVRKFIYADTSAEYEGVCELPNQVERICPVGAYAVGKRGGALFCDTYQKLFDVNITVLRYFNVYGPAQDWRRVIPPVMSAFIIRLLRGERPVIYGTGGKRRDFIYVDDVNEFHLLALQDPRTVGLLLFGLTLARLLVLGSRLIQWGENSRSPFHRWVGVSFLCSVLSMALFAMSVDAFQPTRSMHIFWFYTGLVFASQLWLEREFRQRRQVAKQKAQSGSFGFPIHSGNPALRQVFGRRCSLLQGKTVER